MAFSFDKFVQKSTKGLFLFIVITMVVPLVLWGYMGRSGNEKEEDKSDAGVLYNRIHVSKGEYNRALAVAPASWWWKKYNDPMTMMLMRYGQAPKPPTPEQLSQQVWEDLILLREAKAEGISANEQEVLMGMRDIYQQFVPRGDFNRFEEIIGQIATTAFHINYASFQPWMEEHVTIEKLLSLVTEAEFADYDKVYDRLMKGHQIAKVWYASFDPKLYYKDLKPPTTDEIATYYQKNKEKFKLPPKVQVAYLMATTEEFKKQEPEPSEEAVKKYYEENKSTEFLKPHEHHPGDVHPPGEAHGEEDKPRPFDEVKAEIPGKIKQKAAEAKAAEIMAKVDVALGAAATANSGKYPDDVFDQLKAKFKAEKMDLTYDITVAFDQKQVEDIEKTVGTGSQLGSWAFDSAQKVGDISQKIKTSKGVVLFRIQKKIDAQDAGISERIRESIVKELGKEQIKKKTQQAANNVVQAITTHGMIWARKKYPLDWRLTRYFTVGGSDKAVDDASLGQAISQEIQRGQLLSGKATAIGGSSLSDREKADWAFAVYLEDLVDVPPDDVSTQFPGSRRSLDEEARKKYQDSYIQETVKSAELHVDPSLKKSDVPTDSDPKP